MANRSSKANPTPAEVRAAREKAGLTQTEAAAVIYGTLRAWQNWENDQDPAEQRRMHPGLFELFLAKRQKARRKNGRRQKQSLRNCRVERKRRRRGRK